MKTKPIVLDVETTTSNNGNPFDEANIMVSLGIKELNSIGKVYYEQDWKLNKDSIQNQLDTTNFIILFNGKFDLHWLRNNGFTLDSCSVWDCQLAEFILNYQETPYPSLNSALIKYGLELKLDVVKEEYWDKGKDTTEVPKEILTEYLLRDLEATEEVFFKQWEQFKTDSRYNLFKLQCEDLLILENMEANGIVFNTEKALDKAKEIEDELTIITKRIMEYAGNVPINLNSNDHISCLLYGGTVLEDVRIPVGVYKTGAKIGETRYKILVKEYVLPRIITPLKGSETKKEGYWKVNDDIISSLKTDANSKELLSLIKQQSKLEKLKGTYLIGWTNLIAKMNWPHNKIHGSLNQCRVITGRLSSDNPNLQNADPTTKIYCESRYNE